VNKKHEDLSGYVAAMRAIEEDGDTIEAARHHRGVASSDLHPDAFTAGWKRACDDFLSANASEAGKAANPMMQNIIAILVFLFMVVLPLVIIITALLR
jgi:hypothetical protein